jgi:DNA modification methylase
MLRITRRNVFINIQKNYYNKEEVFRYIGAFSKELCEIIIWEKSNPLPANGANITNAWEFVLVFGEPLKSNSTYTKNHITTSVNQETNSIHKAMMNVQVSDWFMEMFTQKGDVVYDPFSGFGTTAVSALKYERNYLGSEISTEYWELGNKRIQETLDLISGDKLDTFMEW